MIYSITGEIIKKFPNKIIVQQGGFAIEITISRPTYDELPDPGDECFFIYLSSCARRYFNVLRIC